MPRKTKSPIVFLALSPSALATAIGVQPKVIHAAILRGELQVYQRGLARRVLVREAEDWIRNHWAQKTRKPRRAAHADTDQI
jgi:hypothetical protein